MEQTIHPSFDGRSAWPALLAGFGLGLAGLLTLGASLLLARTDLGGALILLARHALRLVPPLVWPAAGFVSALWLGVVAHVWHNPARVTNSYKKARRKR